MRERERARQHRSERCRLSAPTLVTLGQAVRQREGGLCRGRRVRWRVGGRRLAWRGQVLRVVRGDLRWAVGTGQGAQRGPLCLSPLLRRVSVHLAPHIDRRSTVLDSPSGQTATPSAASTNTVSRTGRGRGRAQTAPRSPGSGSRASESGRAGANPDVLGTRGPVV